MKTVSKSQLHGARLSKILMKIIMAVFFSISFLCSVDIKSHCLVFPTKHPPPFPALVTICCYKIQYGKALLFALLITQRFTASKRVQRGCETDVYARSRRKPFYQRGGLRDYISRKKFSKGQYCKQTKTYSMKTISPCISK